MLQEVLANRCQVLSAETFLLLKFFLSVSKAAALLFLTVFTLLAIKPESAKLSLDLLFPPILRLLLQCRLFVGLGRSC